jgi:hypothetical protein
MLVVIPLLLLSGGAPPTPAWPSKDDPAVMNAGGIAYGISNPDPSDPTGYKANFENVSMEYFDVYGIVETRYSQVYWTRDAAVPLPADIIKRFDGKVMAITGEMPSSYLIV